MKNYLMLIVIMGVFGCNDSDPNSEIIGEWILVQRYSLMYGYYGIEKEDQKTEKYTKNGERILYNYQGVEFARANYVVENSKIVVFGSKEESWKFEWEFWFNQDTLIIQHSGGWEYYNELFVRAD